MRLKPHPTSVNIQFLPISPWINLLWLSIVPIVVRCYTNCASIPIQQKSHHIEMFHNGEVKSKIYVYVCTCVHRSLVSYVVPAIHCTITIHHEPISRAYPGIYDVRIPPFIQQFILSYVHTYYYSIDNPMHRSTLRLKH